MLFRIKPVIKSICMLTAIISLFSCQQQKSDDRILLEKIVMLEFDGQDSIEMSLRSDFTSKIISNYYKARFLNEHPVKIHRTNYASNDSIQQKLDQIELTNSIIRLFDDPKISFSKKDIESMIEQQKKLDLWKSSDFAELNVILRESHNPHKSDPAFYGYRVSRPLYSLDKKYAIIHYNLPQKPSYILICKKEKNEWIFIKNLKKVL